MTAYARSAGVVSRQVAGSTVLVALGITTGNLRTRAAELYTLNRTGMVLWELLGSPQTEDALAAHLVQQYQVEAAQARGDVKAFLNDLVEIGAVESSSAS